MQEHTEQDELSNLKPVEQAGDHGMSRDEARRLIEHNSRGKLSELEHYALRRIWEGTYRKDQMLLGTKLVCIDGLESSPTESGMTRGVWTDRSVRRAIARLKHLKLIKIVKKEGNKNVYTLSLYALRTWESDKARIKRKQDEFRKAAKLRMRKMRGGL